MLTARPYGYDSLVDYRDPDCREQVRKIAGGDGVDFAYDCISEGTTVRQVSGTLRKGERMAILQSREGGAWVEHGRDLFTEPIYGAVWEGLGVEIQYQNLMVPASEEARNFAIAFYKWLSEGSGRLEANPIRLIPGGLGRAVTGGFVLLGSGSMETGGGTGARRVSNNPSYLDPFTAVSGAILLPNSSQNIPKRKITADIVGRDEVGQC